VRNSQNKLAITQGEFQKIGLKAVKSTSVFDFLKLDFTSDHFSAGYLG